MPYLDAQRKEELQGNADTVTEGDLTYVLTDAVLKTAAIWLPSALELECEKYLETHRNNFATRLHVVGALECARMEFRRRRPGAYQQAEEALVDCKAKFYAKHVAPYEDQKIEQNGDVF